MRTLVAIVVTLVAAAAAAAAPAPADPPEPARLGPTVFVLTGGGYGHGVGMSQYGAFGQAQAGRTYRQILEWYYRGATLGTLPAPKVRVLLAAAQQAVAVTSTVPFKVRDAAGTTVELPAGEVRLTPKLELVVDGLPSALVPPVSVLPGTSGLLTFRGKAYRGELRLLLDREALTVLDVVGLESYLLGVVPGEMPKAWPLEALKAQAVAARTYTLASLVKGKPFDLYSNVRSQVYHGAQVEAPSTTRAVRETAGEVLLHADKPVLAFYHSSSGGRTASALDAFGADFPYLGSVPDPWDASSPYHRWPPRPLTGAELAKAFGLTSPVVEVTATPTPSGRPSALVLTTKAGRSLEVTALDVRTKLGLRSTAIRLGVLRLAKPDAKPRAGTAVLLQGLARDVDAPVLEQRTNGAWSAAARLTPDTDGSFEAVVRPTGSTRYRLSALGVPGPTLLVQVAAAG